jgi:MFS family permease
VTLLDPAHRIQLSRLRMAATLAFAAMGFHVGVYAVQLAPLASALHLTPLLVGLVGTTAALTGVVVRAALGRFTDRVGRHVVLAVGFGGTALAFVAVAASRSVVALFVSLIAYGLFACWMDIGANTVGSDFETLSRRRAMNGLQAGFSAGACGGALLTAVLLSVGVDYRVIYLGLAVVLAAAALVLLRPLPAHPAVVRPAGADQAGAQEQGDAAALVPKRSSLWRVPAVVFAIVVLTATFFGDGALESFLSVYMNETLGATILLAGLGVALFHAASLGGRLLAHGTLNRFGERRVVSTAGLVAAAGIVVAVLSPTPWLAVVGLLVVGFAEAPLVPVALSLAGSAAPPGRTGEAISLSTSIGFSAFIVSPVIVGGIADLTDLRIGLGIVALTLLVVAALGTRWPRHALQGDGATADETSA